MNNRPWVKKVLTLAIAVSLDTQLLLPGGAFGYLGASWMLGSKAVLETPVLYYWITALLSGGILALSGQYLLAGMMLVHYLLWQIADRKYTQPLLLLAALFASVVQVVLKPTVWPGALLAAALQLAVYISSRNACGDKLRRVRQRERNIRMAEKLELIGTHAKGLEVLSGLESEAAACTEQAYAVYQQAEHLARSKTIVPEPFSSEVFATAQTTHQMRQKIGATQKGLLERLHGMLPREAAALSSVCSWVTDYLQADSRLAHVQLEPRVQVMDDSFIDPDKQYALVCLLLGMSRRALSGYQGETALLFISAFGSNKRTRLTLAIQDPDMPALTGEWPRLAPLDLRELAPFAETLGATCSSGSGSEGQKLYVVQF